MANCYKCGKEVDADNPFEAVVISADMVACSDCDRAAMEQVNEDLDAAKRLLEMM